MKPFALQDATSNCFFVSLWNKSASSTNYLQEAFLIIGEVVSSDPGQLMRIP